MENSLNGKEYINDHCIDLDADLLMFEDKKKKDLHAAVYFKSQMTPFIVADCGILLGDLLNVKVERRSIDDALSIFDTVPFADIYPEYQLNDNGLTEYQHFLAVIEDLCNPSPGEIGKDLQVEIPKFDIVNLYLKLCSENSISIDKDSFYNFICAYSIKTPNMNYVCFNNGKLTHYPINDERTTFLKMCQHSNEIQVGCLYECHHIGDLVFSLLHFILNSGRTVKKCKNCNRLFIPINKSDEKYCPRISNKKSCREIASYKVRMRRENSSEFIKLENSVRTKLLNRTKAKNITEHEKNERQKKYYDFMDEKAMYKDKVNNDEISVSQYVEWLKTIK